MIVILADRSKFRFSCCHDILDASARGKPLCIRVGGEGRSNIDLRCMRISTAGSKSNLPLASPESLTLSPKILNPEPWTLILNPQAQRK